MVSSATAWGVEHAPSDKARVDVGVWRLRVKGEVETGWSRDRGREVTSDPDLRPFPGPVVCQPEQFSAKGTPNPSPHIPGSR
jgi:hypothetical protein